MVPSWSYSKLGDFEKCKKMFWLKHDQKIAEPERPLPPGKTEHANDRGTRLHTNAEEFINGTIDNLDPANEKFFGYNLEFLRELYTDGLVSLEGEWGMNREWEPCGWNGDWIECEDPKLKKIQSVTKLPDRGRRSDFVKMGKAIYKWVPSWLRLKLDAMVMHSDTSATVIDFKTGKKFGNEIKHAEQLQLYQLVTFLRYPKLETVAAELWYLDQPEGQNMTRQVYTRQQGLRFKANFDRRGGLQTTAVDFPANPSKFACMWCPYKPTGTGHCSEGV